MGKAKRHRDRPEGVAMLLRLRRKFVLINMVFAASVLLCVFAAVCVSTYRSARSDVDRTLEQALDERRGEQVPPAGQLPDGQLPDELLEAAKIDGAGEMRIFWTVTVWEEWECWI